MDLYFDIFVLRKEMFENINKILFHLDAQQKKLFEFRQPNGFILVEILISSTDPHFQRSNYKF
jgi:hypothetical protein